MEITWDEINWKPSERAKEIRELIEIYRKSFRLYNYSDIKLWKRIIKLYKKDWDNLHYEMMERERRT